MQFSGIFHRRPRQQKPEQSPANQDLADIQQSLAKRTAVNKDYLKARLNLFLVSMMTNPVKYGLADEGVAIAGDAAGDAGELIDVPVTLYFHQKLIGLAKRENIAKSRRRKMRLIEIAHTACSLTPPGVNIFTQAISPAAFWLSSRELQKGLEEIEAKKALEQQKRGDAPTHDPRRKGQEPRAN